MSAVVILSRVGFYLSIVVISYLAVATLEQQVISTGWDKANHFIAFFVLIALLDYAHFTVDFWMRKIPLLFGFGVLIEVVHIYLPHRMFSVMDVIADVSGLAAYVILRRPIRFVVSCFDERVGGDAAIK